MRAKFIPYPIANFVMINHKLKIKKAACLSEAIVILYFYHNMLAKANQGKTTTVDYGLFTTPNMTLDLPFCGTMVTQPNHKFIYLADMLKEMELLSVIRHHN